MQFAKVLFKTTNRKTTKITTSADATNTRAKTTPDRYSLSWHVLVEIGGTASDTMVMRTDIDNRMVSVKPFFSPFSFGSRNTQGPSSARMITGRIMLMT